MTPMLPDYWLTIRSWAVGLTIGATVILANARAIYEIVFDITMLFVVWATDWTEGPF